MATLLWLLVFSALLIAVVIPRFNRQDLWVIDNYTTGGAPARENLHDAQAYIQQTQYFRGESVRPAMIPFGARPAVPFLAAPLPFDAQTSLNIINVAFLIVGLLSLWGIIAKTTRLPALKVLGATLYVLSFGVFFYGAIGYIDAAAFGLLALGLYLITSNRWFPLVAIMAVGPFVKEQTLTLIPALFGQVRFSMQKGWVKSFAIACASLVLMAGMLLVARSTAGAAGGLGFWGLGWGNAWRILTEGEELLKLLLTLGLPPLLILILLYPCRKMLGDIFRDTAPFWGGAIGAMAFVVYGLLCCNPGGRFTWTVHLFLIPVAIIMLDRYIQERKANRNIESLSAFSRTQSIVNSKR